MLWHLPVAPTEHCHLLQLCRAALSGNRRSELAHAVRPQMRRQASLAQPVFHRIAQPGNCIWIACARAQEWVAVLHPVLPKTLHSDTLQKHDAGWNGVDRGLQGWQHGEHRRLLPRPVFAFALQPTQPRFALTRLRLVEQVLRPKDHYVADARAGIEGEAKPQMRARAKLVRRQEHLCLLARPCRQPGLILFKVALCTQPRTEAGIARGVLL